MNPILMAIILVTVIGLIGAVILVAASIFMYVPVDERVEKITGVLAGANCGACGCAGCADYAKCVVEEGAPVNKCVPGGAKAAAAIAEIMGVEATAAEPMKAVVSCSGTCDKTSKRYEFDGIQSCQAVKGLYGGDGLCKFGCLGYGDCTRACAFDAMHIVDGIAKVDREKCTGCGACANKAVCPQTIIRMVPREATNFIPCSSTEEDDELTRRICGHGCISCGECERACPEGAVSIVNNHAVIDYDKCAGCVACTVKCRKKIIVDTLHDLTKVKEKVAFVKCSGGYKASEVYKKMGLTSCEEAIEKISPKDHELCTTGCCGLGSCTKVCRYDAIHVVNGTAVVDPEKCVGCKDCTYACPKHIITIVPYTGQKQVPCSSTADYEDKAKVCWSSCIACEDCVNNCPNGAIYMEDKHAVIDHELCENCNVCQYVCSRRIIKEMEVPEYTYLQREALGIRKGE